MSITTTKTNEHLTAALETGKLACMYMNGDLSCEEELFSQVRHYSICLLRKNYSDLDWADMEDITQDVCIKTFQALNERTITMPMRIIGWLRKVIKNQVNDHQRDAARLAGLEVQLAARLTHRLRNNPENIATDHVMIENRLNKLPADQRDMIWLQYEGHSINEISKLSGKTPGAVKTAICRAKCAVREDLER